MLKSDICLRPPSTSTESGVSLKYFEPQNRNTAINGYFRHGLGSQTNGGCELFRKHAKPRSTTELQEISLNCPNYISHYSPIHLQPSP